MNVYSSPNPWKRTQEICQHFSMFRVNLLFSFCRCSEEHDHRGGLNNCGVLNNDIFHYETNQQKKEKVRII